MTAPMPATTRRQIIEAYCASHSSMAELGRRFGVCASAAARVLEHAGVRELQQPSGLGQSCSPPPKIPDAVRGTDALEARLVEVYGPREIRHG